MSLSNGKGMMSTASSSGVRKVADGIFDQFPAGLRVLVVDDDPTCLMILEKMLQTCLYQVTKCNRAEIALSLLRENRSGFDVVISDVHMPDMDGFKLLEHIGLEMDLPVIMMSADDGKNVVMKGVTHGACDYLIKPVRIEALKNIWQHVVRKRKNECKELDQSGSMEDGDHLEKPSEDADYSSSGNEGSGRNSKRRKNEEDEAEDKDDSSALKKPRVVWSVELHQQFVAAVNQLGIDKAVPKKILELMNVPGITRENVASHLQKYRLYLRRLSGVSQHQSGVNNSFISPQEATFGPLTSLNGIELQAFAVTGQLPAQSLATLQAGFNRSTTKSGIPMSLVDQRNIFSFENLRSRFGEGQQQISNNGQQMNLLQGTPTTMEPKHLMNLHQSAQSFGSMNMQINAHGGQNGSLQIPMGQPQTREQMINETTGGHVSRFSSSAGHSILSNGSASGVFGRNGFGENGRGAGYSPVSQTTSMLNFPVNTSADLACNSFPLGSTPRMTSLTSKGLFQEANSEVRGPGAYIQSYDISNDLHQQKSHNLEFQNVGLTFDASQHTNSLRGNLDVSTSGLAHQGFSSSQQTSGQNWNASAVGRVMFSTAEGTEYRNPQLIGQHPNTLIADNSMTVKAEVVPDASCQVTGALFPEQFLQEDLVSEFLKQQESIGHVVNEFNFDGYSMDHMPV